MSYKVRFIDGPLEGQTEIVSVLFSKLTKHGIGKGSVSYYRKDNPRDRVKEYRYSVKP